MQQFELGSYVRVNNPRICIDPCRVFETKPGYVRLEDARGNCIDWLREDEVVLDAFLNRMARSI